MTMEEKNEDQENFSSVVVSRHVSGFLSNGWQLSGI
jgi:hypothetical protein